MARRRNYGLLGETMDRIAREKAGVWGPYNVADYIQETLGEGPSGPSFSAYYNEKTEIPSYAMRFFVQAFECTQAEQEELAWVRTFRHDLAA